MCARSSKQPWMVLALLGFLGGTVLPCLAAAPPAKPAEIEFRLVPHDRPDVTVDTLEREKPVTRPVTTARGTEFQQIGLDLVCWARNVLLDGQPLFERFHDGKYIDRLPKAKRALNAGRHVLWPGEHAFSVAADGSVTSESAELIVEKGLVRIRAYPVTVRAYDADAGTRETAAVAEAVPLPNMTVRDATENEPEDPKKEIKPHELLPVYERFAPLTVWLPASKTGKGYALHPMGLTFRLGAEGIAASGAGGAMPGVTIKDWTIEIPLFSYPVVGDGGCSMVVQGIDKISWSPQEAGRAKRTSWYPRRGQYELRVSDAGPAILTDGGLLAMPVKAMRVDMPDPAKGLQRALLVELAASHYRPGDKVRARIQAIGGTTAVPAVDAVPFGRVQAFDGGPWTELALSAGENGETAFAVPDLPDDVCRLRLGVRPKGSAGVPPALSSGLSADTLITVARERTAAIGLFTQRGRTAFFRGETFWIGLGAIAKNSPIPKGATLEVDLTGPDGRRLTILRENLAKRVDGRETFIVRIEGQSSMALCAGDYSIVATLGELKSRPKRITIVEPEPRTHFTNLLSGKYNVLGDEYSRVIHSGEGAEEFARTLVSMGYNGFMGMSYDMNRVLRPDSEVERLVRQRPELGPWESYLQPSGRDRFADAAVRNNLPFWENMLTYNDTSLPREEKIIAACDRFTGLEVSSMQHSPAFRGVCLYDEIYSRSLIDNSVVVAAFEQAHERSYREVNQGLTSAKAMKALDRFVGRPAGQRPYPDLAAFRTWPAHEDRDWRVLSARLAGAAKEAMPGSFNFVLNRYWGGNGGNLGLFGKEEELYAPLDAAACVMYKDGGVGDRPVFAPMQADVMRVRDGLPVWTQLHNFSGSGLYGAHLLRQAFFALSHKVEGFTYFTIQHDPKAPQYADNRETIRAIGGTLCTRYGDFFLSLQKGYKQVAIYYSRDADYLTLKKTNNVRYQCEGLWVACVRAGFPADFLRDADIRAGRGMAYNVIFVPGFQFEEECPPETLEALKRLVGAGKVLAVERSSKLPIEGVTRLESELDEYDDKCGGAFPKFIDFESEMVWDQTEETTKLVREFLATRVPPAARHNALVGPGWLRRGGGEYMVLPNFAYTGFTGLYKTLYQAPGCVNLTFPKRPPVCYDLLEMRRVPVPLVASPPVPGDWMTLEADMRHYPGKVYAFLPAAVASVGLKSSAAVRAGGTLRYEASVLDEQGKAIDASFPLEVRLLDPGGATALEIYRAAAPALTGAYVIPANAPEGNWTLRVRELVSGAAAEARVAVQAGEGARHSVVAATLDARKVLTYEPERIRSFFGKKGPAIAIPLGPAQAWVRPVAERCATFLARRGQETRIVPAEQVLRTPGPWDAEKPVIDGSRLWRGDVVAPGVLADAPLILLGRRGENVFIDALIGRDALVAPVSDSFPGPKRALLSWTRRAFSNEHDTVCVLACDEEGLAAGVDELAAILEGKGDGEPSHPEVRAAFPPLDRKGPGEVGGGEGGALADGTPAKREVSSFGDAIFGEDMVRCLDVEPKTGRTLVGTFGYGHNLFCLGPDGKALWKVFLPEHNVYLARWYDEGRRVVAATGRGYLVSLLDGQDGKVLCRFASTEWPQKHWNEGAVETEVQIEINAALRQILIGGLTGLMAVDFDGKRQWFYDRAEAAAAIPKEADPGAAAAEFGNSVFPGNFALSPDGSKIAYGEYEICGSTVVMLRVTNVWAFRPKVLDARTGKVLSLSLDDPGNKTEPYGWSVSWPPRSEVPFVQTGSITAPLLADGKLGERTTLPGRRLGDGSILVSGTTNVERREADGKVIWRAEGLPLCIPALDLVQEPAGRLYRCDQDGGIHCIELKAGRQLWTARLPFSAVLAPRGDGLIAGALDGTIASLGADGGRAFSVRLRDLHEMPKSDYAGYIEAARQAVPDSTAALYPAGEDRPGEYDGILRLGIEQLEDPGFEGTSAAGSPAWTTEKEDVQFSDQAHGGKRALRLAAGKLATQTPARRVVPSATYLLEFFYRLNSPEAKLVAGAQLRGEGETLTATMFRGRPGEWTFGRLAVKSLATTKQMVIGFEAAGGEVLVDDATLRPVRFPSANLLACDELHSVEPTFVRDIRVWYKKIPPALETKLMGRNRVAAYKQGGTETATRYTEEQAFLHNGRLDDVGPVWTYNPDAMGFSVVLTQPAWVSHLVLYLNNSTPQNVYQTISIVANDLETRIPKAVALVRNNHRRFIVVHFDKPLHTDALRILPGHQARTHRDCLTEVEVYGPLGGPEQGGAARRFPDDPLGWPMFMGCPSHVPERRPADLTGTYRERGRVQSGSPAFFVGATAAQDLCTLGDASGSIRSMKLLLPADPKAQVQWGPSWVLGTITPTTTPARYSGRLLAGCADEKLHAVADSGAHLWAFQSEGRIYSSPVPAGDDVYVGSDDGKLYKVDVDSGILIWEFKTGGRIRGAPALADGRVLVPSWDGFLYAVEADAGREVWRAPIAKYTRSSPAVAGGRVYLGGEDGKIRCFEAASGKLLWQGDLGGRISTCPLVTELGAVFANEEGRVALAGDGGAIKWSRQLDAVIKGQPVATQSQILVPASRGVEILRLADGAPDERITLPAQPRDVIAAIPYGDRICVVTATAKSHETSGRSYATLEGLAMLWVPEGKMAPPGGAK